MKRVLIPLWIIQLICLVIFAAGAGFALYVVDKANDDYGFDENVQNALKYAFGTNVHRPLLTDVAALA